MIPLFLTSEEVQALQASQIEAWGGLHGLRDGGALESAVAAPMNHYLYGTGELFDCAAALMYALIVNHPFVDGNKRVGVLAGAVTLEMNGVVLREDQAWVDALEAIAWQSAQAKASREDVAALWRSGVI